MTSPNSRRPLRLVALLLGAGALAWVAVYILVPRWIAQDPERNMARLGLVGRRMTYPAFQHYWPRYNLVALGLVACGFVGLLLLSTDAGQRLLNRWLGPITSAPAGYGLGPSRLRAVRLVWLLVLLPQFLCVLSGFEAWPFSPYGMYSAVQAPVVSVPRLAVLTAGGPVTVRDPEWLKPFDTSRLDVALARFIRENNTSGIRQATDFALTRYRAVRVKSRDTLPEAVGIGLYRDTWLLQPGAANVSQPDSTTVVFEERRP